MVTYGLLVYGIAAKTNLIKIEKAQRINTMFFRKKVETLSDILEVNTHVELSLRICKDL